MLCHPCKMGSGVYESGGPRRDYWANTALLMVQVAELSFLAMIAWDSLALFAVLLATAKLASGATYAARLRLPTGEVGVM